MFGKSNHLLIILSCCNFHSALKYRIIVSYHIVWPNEVLVHYWKQKSAFVPHLTAFVKK